MTNTILWIDDDHDLLRSQRMNLTEDGYNVFIEPDVDKALSIISGSREKLCGIILDVMMNPGKILKNKNHHGGLKTGLVFLEYLNEENLLQGLKVFVFTHRIDSEMSEDIQKMDVHYHLKQDHKGKKIVDLVKKEFSGACS